MVDSTAADSISEPSADAKNSSLSLARHRGCRNFGLMPIQAQPRSAYSGHPIVKGGLPLTQILALARELKKYTLDADLHRRGNENEVLTQPPSYSARHFLPECPHERSRTRNRFSSRSTGEREYKCQLKRIPGRSS